MKHQSSKTQLALSAVCAVLFAGVAQADLITSVSGGDAVITNTAPISWTLDGTAAGSDTQWAILIDGLGGTAAGTSGIVFNTDVIGNMTLTIGARSTNDHLAAAVRSGTSAGVIGPEDGALSFQFTNPPFTPTNGDTVILSAGTVTLVGRGSDVDGNVVTPFVGDVILMTGGGTQIGSPHAVPEPSSMLYAAGALCWCIGFRRRRRPLS